MQHIGMYNYHCVKCGGFVPEPMKAYGYAGRYCHCPVPTKPSQTTDYMEHLALLEQPFGEPPGKGQGGDWRDQD